MLVKGATDGKPFKSNNIPAASASITWQWQWQWKCFITIKLQCCNSKWTIKHKNIDFAGKQAYNTGYINCSKCSFTTVHWYWWESLCGKEGKKPYLFNICTCKQGAVQVTEIYTALHNLIAYHNEIQVPFIPSKKKSTFAQFIYIVKHVDCLLSSGLILEVWRYIYVCVRVCVLIMLDECALCIIFGDIIFLIWI